MMQQYEALRQRVSDNTLLFFRLGDFYELFDEDAKTGARILGITLTHRNGTPMAGIPYHAANSYIPKILAAGLKVAICEQLEPASPGKLVKRSLTRILSPGTLLEEDQVSSTQNSYMVALSYKAKAFSLAWLDLTTGDFQLAKDPLLDKLLPVLYALDPKEIILPEGVFYKQLDALQECTAKDQFFALCQNRIITEVPPTSFEAQGAGEKIARALKVLSLECFGIDTKDPALASAAALLDYATENLCALPQNLYALREYSPQKALLIDPNTLRHLEIFKTHKQSYDGSLLSAMNATVTAAGSRLLEQYLTAPSQDLREIKKRQNAVGAFVREPSRSQELEHTLASTRDLIRIISRIQNNIRNPRELGGIRDTLKQLPLILKQLQAFESADLNSLKSAIHPFDGLYALLQDALAESLPNNLLEGGYIRDAYRAELDELRLSGHKQKEWLAKLEADEQAKSGIKHLKVRYNEAYGYFIEISKSNLSLVPDHYIRKQTLTTGERFYTPELKEKEKEILYSRQKAIALELAIFKELVQAVLSEAPLLLETAQALASLDVFLSWAKLARQWNYTCPIVDDSYALEIEDGRHPVIEQALKKRETGSSKPFVPNPTELSSEKQPMMLITGPNMAGKSTYIRQVALISIMAHTGSWVPAKRCRIGLMDRVFSRIGASDELSQGYSTFMVEMSETANILNNATPRSLIVLDEIGRGTSTYDGLSLAWSIVEYLHKYPEPSPKTLFATHYQELTQLEGSLKGLKNYHVKVEEWKDEIIFMHQLVPGAADRSYGIQVARLAGLPASVIDRATVLLKGLEGSAALESPSPKTVQVAAKPKVLAPAGADQLVLL
jgi:DNA mismatch repair protein MutS